MPAGRRRSAGAGLTSLFPGDVRLPDGFRGTVLTGEAAERQASLVSGPFRARPRAYLTPLDPAELRHLLRWSWNEGVPLIPRGGGTGMPGGNLGPHVVVDLAALSGATEIEPLGADRFRVGVGAVAGQVDAAARAGGGFLPWLPSSAPWCRIGGVAANNGAGARSFRYGSIAPWVEGIEGFHPWGEPFRVRRDEAVPETFDAAIRAAEGILDGELRGWPEVRKNASGYALDRTFATRSPVDLLVGSEGTLGIFTHLTLRAARLPAARGLGLLRVDTAEALAAVALGAEELGTESCEFLGRRLLEMAGLNGDPVIGPLARNAFALVLMEVAGSVREVENRLSALGAAFGEAPERMRRTRDPAEMERLWGLRHAASPTIHREADRGRISTQFIEDCVVPPARLGDFLTGLEAILARHELDAVVFGHAGDGNVHVNPLVDLGRDDWLRGVRETLVEVAELVASLGGTLSGEHGDGRLRAPLLPRIWSPEIVEAFREVRTLLDPRGTLNPGVILPLPDQDPLENFVPRPRAFPT